MNTQRIKSLLVLAAWLVVFARSLYAGEASVIQEKDLIVLFDPPLGNVAREVTDIYPGIKVAVESIFGWKLNLKPSVQLIKDRKDFGMTAKSPLTVAFAVPRRNLIVIDHSRMTVHPFSLETTLKHELCHLLLHHHISEDILPRWFDEGVCQWASDGIGDIVMDQKRSRLNRAAFKGAFIPLGALQESFPNDKERLLLAYEESKSFVDHVIGTFGKEGILEVLEYMKEGEDIDAAILRAVSVPLETLEREWHHSLRQQVTWFTYFSYHLYEILFALMSLITAYAFIRIIIKKRAYMKEDEEDIPFS